MSSSRKKKPASPAKVRIIGGRWRGRTLNVLNKDGLRPTGDRVRETLFNWIQFDLPGTHCLDLCAGTGALGFEALSRGAASCDFVEPDKDTANLLAQNANTLKAEHARVHHQTAQAFLANDQGAQTQYPQPEIGLIFLDPPFSLNLWAPLLTQITESLLLAEDALLYMETPAELAVTMPPNWQPYKDKKAGQVRFGLHRLITLT